MFVSRRSTFYLCVRFYFLCFKCHVGQLISTCLVELFNLIVEVDGNRVDATADKERQVRSDIDGLIAIFDYDCRYPNF